MSHSKRLTYYTILFLCVCAAAVGFFLCEVARVMETDASGDSSEGISRSSAVYNGLLTFIDEGFRIAASNGQQELR